MNHQAQIYKSDQRGCVESEIFRRFSTFNFGEYQEQSRNPFGSLYALNDETLGAGNHIFRLLEADTDIILLPLVGGIVYKDSLGNHEIIGTEEIRIFSANEGMNYELINPYEKDLVNYLQIWIRPERPFEACSHQKMFDLVEKNTLISLFAPNADLPVHSNSYGFIGIFEGRKDNVYTLKNPKNGLFIFVVNGAFEFENRLIELRDGLSLSGVVEVEFEALSDNAILLLLEIPLL